MKLIYYFSLFFLLVIIINVIIIRAWRKKNTYKYDCKVLYSDDAFWEYDGKLARLKIQTLGEMNLFFIFSLFPLLFTYGLEDICFYLINGVSLLLCLAIGVMQTISNIFEIKSPSVLTTDSLYLPLNGVRKEIQVKSIEKIVFPNIKWIKIFYTGGTVSIPHDFFTRSGVLFNLLKERGIKFLES